LPASTGVKSGSAAAAGVFVAGGVVTGAVAAEEVAAVVEVGNAAWLVGKFGSTATAPVRALVEITAVGAVAAEVEPEEAA
jgi:hypothetical protein